MRILFLHGINQQGRGASTLLRSWSDLLLAASPDGTFAPADMALPFYGDVLADRAGSADVAVAQGGAATDADEAVFVADALEEQALAAGVGAREIALEQRRLASENPGAIAQGFPMSRRVNAVVAALERVSPLHGDVALRLLDQAHAYLKRPRVASAVDDIVRPALDGGPAIVVAHSLGTVVAFKLLRELATAGRPVQVPLLVTLGSPLSLRTVRAALGPPLRVPDGVGRWLNAVDPNDFIALGRSLDASNFCDGIENITDIAHVGGDAHALEGYLSDPRVAGAIASAYARSPNRP